MAKRKASDRYDKYPYTCVADAVGYLDTVVIRDAEARNTFLLKLWPFAAHCVDGSLRGCQVWMDPTDREDLDSCVWLYLLEKWFPRIKLGRASTPPQTIAGYLSVTVRGLVKNFLAEMFDRMACEPGEWIYEPEATFVKEADFKLDRKGLRQEVKRNVDHYLKIRRRRSTEVREVVERMMRVLLWKEYRKSGQLVGVRRGDSSHSVVGAVPVGGDGP